MEQCEKASMRNWCLREYFKGRKRIMKISGGEPSGELAGGAETCLAYYRNNREARGWRRVIEVVGRADRSVRAILKASAFPLGDKGCC